MIYLKTYLLVFFSFLFICQGCTQVTSSKAGNTFTSTLSENDCEIIRVAVRHLWENGANYLFDGAEDPRKVLVHRESITVRMKKGYHYPEYKLSSNVPSEYVKDEMQDSFVKRNATSCSISLCGFSSNKVQSHDIRWDRSESALSFLLKFPERYPHAKGYIKVFLPAYSEDGELAVLRMSLGPSHHGASGSYVLRRTPKGWGVVWRDIAVFL
jgi:hypothetical protein